MGGFCLLVEFHREGCANNRAAPSSFFYGSLVSSTAVYQTLAVLGRFSATHYL